MLFSSWITSAAQSGEVSGVIKPFANLLWMIALPGWVAVSVLPSEVSRASATIILIANSIGWASWLFGIFVLFEVRALMHQGAATATEDVVASPSRRAFLTDSALGSIAICSGGAAGYGTLVEPWSIEVRRYEIPVADLPSGLDGLKIAHVSDTHVGRRIPDSFIEQAYQRAMDLQPDLIVLTGDHVHSRADFNQRAADLCASMMGAFRGRVIGVLGNHDWWGDGDDLTERMKNAGVHMIDNDRVWIDADHRAVVLDEPAGESIAIVGLGDLTDSVVRPSRAFRDVSEGTARVVLAHNPDTAEISELSGGLSRELSGDSSPRVDLMMSGHTHGGQVRIPFVGTPIIPSRYGQKYAGGLVQGPGFPVVVSRGIGMSMLPVRVGVPPEVGLVTLVRG
ncbi:MAG: metallophosphoesterase [Phycisphaerales bacterium]